jgi:hypothetical protein
VSGPGARPARIIALRELLSDVRADYFEGSDVLREIDGLPGN